MPRSRRFRRTARYVAYVQRDIDPIRPLDSSDGHAQQRADRLACARTSPVCPSITPDGNFVDFIGRPGAGVRAEAVSYSLAGLPAKVLIDQVHSPLGMVARRQEVRVPLASTIAAACGAVLARDGDRRRQRRTGGRVERSAFRLVTFGLPSGRMTAPAWSPDGRLIALRGYGRGPDGKTTQHGRDVEGGDEERGGSRGCPLTFAERGVGVAWLDADGLLLRMKTGSSGGWRSPGAMSGGHRQRPDRLWGRWA